MKHENINTIISCLGLALASFTAFMQLKPQSDQLGLIVKADNSNNTGFYIKDNGFFWDDYLREHKKLAGPYNIELEVSNNLNRPVTVKDINIFLIGENNEASYYIGLTDTNSPFLKDPMSFEPHTVKRLNFNINIPIDYNENEQVCFHHEGFISDSDSYYDSIKNCYYRRGFDMLGNKVKSEDIGGGYVTYSSENKINLKYMVTMITGDDTKISKVVNIKG